jgi:hypothetical protein
MEFSTASKTEYMAKAYELATLSVHHVNQNGAMLLSQDGLRTIGVGVTSIPDGLNCTDMRRANDDYYQHAAIGAICDAALRGKSTSKSIMICPWVASMDAVHVLIAAGVGRLIVHWPRMALTNLANTDGPAEIMGVLQEAGLPMESIDWPIASAPPVLVNGAPWSSFGVVIDPYSRYRTQTPRR